MTDVDKDQLRKQQQEVIDQVNATLAELNIDLDQKKLRIIELRKLLMQEQALTCVLQARITEFEKAADEEKSKVVKVGAGRRK